MEAWAQMRPASWSSVQIRSRKIARGCGKDNFSCWVCAYCSFCHHSPGAMLKEKQQWLKNCILKPLWSEERSCLIWRWVCYCNTWLPPCSKGQQCSLWSTVSSLPLVTSAGPGTAICVVILLYTHYTTTQRTMLASYSFLSKGSSLGLMHSTSE